MEIMFNLIPSYQEEFRLALLKNSNEHNFFADRVSFF